MREVLISIQPKWCELIASRKKTVEVRKTKPKCETPFKCYIYETKDKSFENIGIFGYRPDGKTYNFHHNGGKVIGEFVCDCITPLYNVCYDEWERLLGGLHRIEKQLVENACLTKKELHSYANGKRCYGWHITDLVVYDEPRELSEFYHYCGDDPNCSGCEAHYFSNTECGKEDYCCSPIEGCKPIKRAPQSWQFCVATEPRQTAD